MKRRHRNIVVGGAFVALGLTVYAWRDVYFFLALRRMQESEETLAEYARSAPASFEGRVFDYFLSTPRGRESAARLMFRSTKDLFPKLDESITDDVKHLVIAVTSEGAFCKTYNEGSCTGIRYHFADGRRGLEHLVAIRSRVGGFVLEDATGRWEILDAGEAESRLRSTLDRSFIPVREALPVLHDGGYALLLEKYEFKEH